MNISLFNHCSLSVNGHCEALGVHLAVRCSLLLTLSLPLAPSSNLWWESYRHWAVTCNKNTTGINRWPGSVELLNFLNLLWMKLHVVWKFVTCSNPCSNLSSLFNFHWVFNIFSTWKWLGLHHRAVLCAQLLVTVGSKQRAMLWTISYQMHWLLTVTV